MTNYEKIKNMTVDELEQLLISFKQCPKCMKYNNNCFPVFNIKQWLESEWEQE